MPTTAVDLVFVILVATVGAAIGWCLRSSDAHRRSGKNGDQTRYARKVLARLHELATDVAADVGEHTSRVEEINEELSSTPVHETEAVVSAVDKLIQANNQMQQQLASADEKLQEQARQIESHAAEARTDVLTGLANRRAFDDEMAQRFAEFQRHGRTFSVVMFDVDHFKAFNDSHGHQAGDEVLRGLAEVLRKNARDMDTVARYGGEEFAVILPGISAAGANSGAKRICEVIEGTQFRFKAADLQVTVSVGVAEVLLGEGTFILVQRADAALYASKEAGRNCVHWHDGRAIHPVGNQEKPPGKDAQSEDAPGEQSPAETEAAKPEEPLAAPELRDDDHGGLPDRAAFGKSLNRRLAEWRRGGAPPSVILVRIDGYSKITSDHGKQGGDVVLRATTQFLNAAIRDMDLLASYDPATFAVLLPGAQLAETMGVAERLRKAIARCSLPLGGGQLQFTVSVSGAEAIEDDDLPKLLRRAEEALEAAYKSGGNCSYFHTGQWSEMSGASLQRMG